MPSLINTLKNDVAYMASSNKWSIVRGMPCHLPHGILICGIKNNFEIKKMKYS